MVQIITVDGEELVSVPLLMAYHKPFGMLSTMGDPLGRPSLTEGVPSQWKRMGLHPVGRLDADTTGLLLFSRDGVLTQRLLHPSCEIEREYVAAVEGDATRADLADLLAAGVATSDGVFPARLVRQAEGEVQLVVTEGKYRMVRRILANVGLPVTALHRIRYGAVSLDSLQISEGQWTAVSEDVEAWAQYLLAAKGSLRKTFKSG